MADSSFPGPDWPQTIVEIDTLARSKKLPDQEIESLWQTHDVLAVLFAGRYRGSGRPFINHLAGTAGLALLHDRSYTEVLATYAHAAYEQGEFGQVATGGSKKNRQTLRAVIGEEAEALVYQYGDFNWLEILEQHSAGKAISLSRQQQQLLVMRLFNELDDSMDCGAYPARWTHECLHRLDVGASLAEALGKNTVARHLRGQEERLRSAGVMTIDGTRRKKSATIANPAWRARPLLKLSRKLSGMLARLARQFPKPPD